MMRKHLLLLLSAAIALSLSGTSQAAGIPLVITGGGHNYLPGDEQLPQDALMVTRGSEIDYLNLDAHEHTLTSLRKRGRQPFFDSGSTANGETKRVVGVADLLPGRYRFICVFHPDEMRGVLIVEEL